MKTLDSSLRIILFIVAIILLGFGIYLSLSNSPVNATATYTAGIFCLVFVYLSSFQSFEGLGIKAKLLDQKIEESTAVIKRLQKLLVLMASMLFSLSARMGRFGSGMPRSDRYHLAEDIEKEFLSNGISTEELEVAKLDWHHFNTIDLYSPIFKNLRTATSQKHQAFRNELSTKESEEDSPLKQLETERIENKIKSIERFQEDLGGLIKMREFESVPSLFKSSLNSCIAFTEEEKAEIYNELKEELSDLEYYAHEHKFRRLDVWLNNKNE